MLLYVSHHFISYIIKLLFFADLKKFFCGFQKFSKILSVLSYLYHPMYTPIYNLISVPSYLYPPICTLLSVPSYLYPRIYTHLSVPSYMYPPICTLLFVPSYIYPPICTLLSVPSLSVPSYLYPPICTLLHWSNGKEIFFLEKNKH